MHKGGQDQTGRMKIEGLVRRGSDACCSMTPKRCPESTLELVVDKQADE